jgi:hypothetical protein
MERPERVVLIILGALFQRWGAMAPALWVLAVLSTVTVIHRISYTYAMAKALQLDRALPASSRHAETTVEPTPIRPASPGAANAASMSATSLHTGTPASISSSEQSGLLSATRSPRG